MSEKKDKKSKKTRSFSAMDGAALLFFGGALTPEQKSKRAQKLRDKHDDPETYAFYDKYTTPQEKKAWKELKADAQAYCGQIGKTIYPVPATPTDAVYDVLENQPIPMRFFTTDPVPDVDANVPSQNNGLTLAYKTFGSPNGPAILIPTCFSGQIRSTLNFLYEGPGAPLKDYFVIVCGLLGGGDSSSPSNAPSHMRGSKFPKVTYEDNIRLQYALCRALGVTQLEAYIGFSMGGQQAYYMAAMFPEFVNSIVVLASSARTSWHNKSFLEGPKTALLNSIDWHAGEYTEPARKGTVAFARAYSTWALSSAWFRQRNWEKLGCASVEDYLSTNWDDEMGALDANDLLCMVNTWWHGNLATVGKGDGSLEQALAGIKAKVLLMPSRTDLYFPPEDSEEEVKHLARGKLVIVESVWGHLAGGEFGPEEDQQFIGKEVRRFLSDTQESKCHV
ncbi:Alpha/beta hydrolase fold-1 [Purpureocillium lavendulum]|uniref:Alpha/beta hydrolase fold-1 n=1 Tax=Purpureocillium lavendulum TaxID=1247861 RepID=A0AB34FU92_9HYPO|nr:Alpha/beta hydrolase fold-1 [Purpureocillium lavendulum]